MGDSVDLTVVVLSWNTREGTLRAMASVAAGCAPFTARAVCVDNASHDGSAAAVRAAHPEAIVVENPANLGFARGNNAAIPYLDGRCVVFLNSDAEATPGALAHLVRHLDAHPAAGVAAPALVGFDGAPQRTAWGIPTAGALLHQYTPLGWLGLGRRATRAQRTRPQTSGPTPVVSGACLAVRTGLFRRLGGFDEGYPFYVEDVDLCWRAAAAQAQVHLAADGPPVRHEGGASVALAGGTTRLPLLQGWLRFQRKRLPPAAYAVFAPVFAAGVAARTAAEAILAPLRALARRLAGRAPAAARAYRLGRERVRFLERDLLALLRATAPPPTAAAILTRRPAANA